MDEFVCRNHLRACIKYIYANNIFFISIESSFVELFHTELFFICLFFSKLTWALSSNDYIISGQYSFWFIYSSFLHAIACRSNHVCFFPRIGRIVAISRTSTRGEWKRASERTNERIRVGILALHACYKIVINIDHILLIN